MQMRGKFYTFRRNGSNKFLYILPSVCCPTFLAVVRAKIVRGTCFFCYVRPPKSGKNCLEEKKLKKLPTPIASPDSPEIFSDLSDMPLGNFTRIGQRYAPIT